MLDILSPAIRILVFFAWTRLGTMGYFTPENASEFAKVTMDLIMYSVPILYAAWAAHREAKARRK